MEQEILQGVEKDELPENEQRRRLIISEVKRYVQDGLSLQDACEKLDITPIIFWNWEPDFRVYTKRIKPVGSGRKRRYATPGKRIQQELDAPEEIEAQEPEPKRKYISQLSTFIEEAKLQL